MATVTVSSKGQIVLPKQLRQELSIQEDDRIELRRVGDQIILQVVPRASFTTNWCEWRGVLHGSSALQDHEREHAEEVADEQLP